MFTSRSGFPNGPARGVHRVILRCVSAQPIPLPPGWPVAFRGSVAIAAGLVTAKMLRGPRFLRVFPDTYVRRASASPDLRLRSLAAYRYVEGRGVLSGYSAAVLLGADCADPEAPAEVTVPGGGQRPHDGPQVHRGVLSEDEIRRCRGVLVTSPRRTAFDLGRRPDLVEAVVGIDALANAGRFAPADVLELAQHHPGARGCRDLRRQSPSPIWSLRKSSGASSQARMRKARPSERISPKIAY